ncbi:O-antigen flippase [Algibacter marinivivus]|uniref:O-antigen flippase n=1 Tax=Algibacter marinivivus TaxID=2100723 RepID=A0A2U2X1Y9_9FLAO|nr:O-antigen translocase [Algibacter marinivivus]PWH81806.1 O-antigen flippase [Algibacter marinivivus]
MKIPSFIKNNLLLKVTSANTGLVLVRMLSSLLSQKVLAVLIGAEGIALVGNLKNVIGFFEQFSILGTSNGLVKYISEYKDDKKQLSNLFSTVFVFSVLAALLSFVILFFWSNTLSDIVFGNGSSYSYIFKILAFLIPFMGVNAVLYSLLNGLSAYKLFSKIGVVIVITSTVLIVFLTYQYGIKGSLIAISIVPLLQFLVYTLFGVKTYKTLIDLKSVRFNLNFKNQLMSYSLMALIVVFSINITDIALRHLIENRVSIAEAGNWTAMNSISKVYMQFTAAIFPLYILPVYAKISNSTDFRKEVVKIYKMLLPLLVVGMFMVFVFREFIITALYTDEFLGMASLFKWQLLGDLIKFIAIVLSYQFIAKKQIGYFIFTEVLSVLLFYGFSVYFIDIYGTDGVVLAHFIRYIIFFIVVLFILRHNFIGKKRVI